MTIHIDRGDKVKINDIEFHGNDKVSKLRLLKAIKKQKRKIPYVFTSAQNTLKLTIKKTSPMWWTNKKKRGTAMRALFLILFS